MKRYQLLILAVLLAVIVVITMPIVYENGSAKQLWQFKTLGSVYTAPIVANGYVYASSYFDQSERGGIYCLNASTGTLVWQKIWNTTGNYDRPLFVEVHGNYLYYASEEAGTNCLEALTGEHVWNFTDGTFINPPAVSEGTLYARNDNNFYALNAYNGRIIWSQPIGNLAYGQVFDNGRIFLPQQKSDGSPSTVYCLNSADGELSWNFSIQGYADSLLVSADALYVTSYKIDYSNNVPFFTGNLYVLAKETGDKKWNFTTETYRGESPNAQLVLSSDKIFLDACSKIYAFDASNGIKLWNRTNENPNYPHLVLNSRLFVSAGSININGHGSLAALNPSTGATIWSFELSDNYVSAPVFLGNQVIVGSSGSMFFSKNSHSVYSIDEHTGKQLWVTSIAGNPVGITTDKGKIYVGAEFSTPENRDFEGNGTVYALKPTGISPPTLPTPELFPTLLTIAVVVIALVVISLAIYFKKRKH